MLIVRDLVNALFEPKSVALMIGSTEIELVCCDSDRVEPEMLDMTGDFVVESINSMKPREYTVWVLSRPVKAGEC